jgi:hypothetical protein
MTRDNNVPYLVEADPDKIIYEITLDLPDAGLLPGAIPPDFHEVPPDTDIPADADIPRDATVEATPLFNKAPGPCQLTQLCRSALNNQPYDRHPPRMFL